MKKKIFLYSLAGMLLLSLLTNLVLFEISNFESTEPVVLSNERYVYIAATSDKDLIEADIAGVRKFEDEFGVSVEIVSPKQLDSVDQVRLMIEAIESNPAGILISAWDPSLIPFVNRAVDAGIPTVTVETDLPDSKRLAYIGIDWYKFGIRQADALARLIGESGTVVALGMTGANSTDQGFAGFKYGMSRYDNIYMLDGYDDMGTVEEAERITKQILENYAIAGMAGFDTNSGIGISLAIQEMGMKDQVKVSCVGMTPIHMQYLKDGTVHLLFGFMRDQYTYYGCKLLYDLNHNDLKITNEDVKNGITNIPQMIVTESIELNHDNHNVEIIEGP